jgi:hypothetical protein
VSVGVANAPYNIITSMPGGSAGSAGVQEVDAGLVFGTGVRHFMTSFGIRNEGGRLLFPRREQARSDEAVARLIFDHATVLVEAEDQRRQSNKNWSEV